MSDKAFEEWFEKEYPDTAKDYEAISIAFKSMGLEAWHASGEYHTKKARKQAVEEVIKILEKYRCDGAPHDDNFFPAEDLLDEIRKRFL